MSQKQSPRTHSAHLVPVDLQIRSAAGHRLTSDDLDDIEAMSHPDDDNGPCPMEGMSAAELDQVEREWRAHRLVSMGISPEVVF